MKVEVIAGFGNWLVRKLNGNKSIIALCTKKYYAQAIARALNK